MGIKKLTSWGAGALLTVLLTFAATTASAQFAVKTNLLYDATLTPNLGVELGLSKKMSAQVYYGYNSWAPKPWSKEDGSKVHHWVVMPELRWWQCTTFNGWFYGVHLMGGEFNAANVNLPIPGAFFGGENLQKMVKDYRCEGKYLGGGLTVGYQWILSRHWNLEAEAGVGYDHVWYKQFPCSECGTKISDAQTNYVGLTKLGLAIMYIF